MSYGPHERSVSEKLKSPSPDGRGNQALRTPSSMISAAAFIVASFLLLSAGCVSSRALTTASLQKKISRVGAEVIDKTGYVARLSSMRVGRTGFFYLLDHEGFVLAHPVRALVGRSFSGSPFMKRMRESGSGCMKYSLENGGNLLFFQTLENGWILCLSVMAEEIHGPVPDCEPVEGQ